MTNCSEWTFQPGLSPHGNKMCRGGKMCLQNIKFDMSQSVTGWQNLPQHGPLSLSKGRSWGSSSFHTSLLQAISGLVCIALCVCFKLLSTSDLPRCKPLVIIALPASLSAWSFSVTPECPGQYIHRNFQRWLLNIDICQSRLPIPLFTFYSKHISVRMMACVVTSWGNPVESMMGDCFHFHCQAGGWDHIDCTVFMDGVVALCLTVKPCLICSFN